MESLVNIIKENLNGASFISLDTITDPRLTGGKKNPFVGNTSKITTGSSVMIAQNKNSSSYNNMVKRRLTEEGKDAEDFQLSPRSWGERIEGTPFIKHTKKGSDTESYYLELIFLKPGIVTYQVDGVETAPEDIQGLPKRVEGEQGGLDNKVVIRTVCVDNITCIRAFGKVIEDFYFDINEF